MICGRACSHAQATTLDLQPVSLTGNANAKDQKASDAEDLAFL